MNIAFGFLFVVVAVVTLTQGSEKWNYDATSLVGPSNWYKAYPACNDTKQSSKQSPINIVSGDAKYNASLPLPTMKNYNVGHQNTNLQILNNGHSLKVIPKRGVSDSKETITYKGVIYELAQFHFHWGSTATQGSEHTMDGKAYQAEVHFVHFNTKYTDLGQAVDKSDGLLVFGNFISANGATDNENYKTIITALSSVIYKDQNTTISHFALEELLPENSPLKIFTYSGSLTTPGCFESVRWIVNNAVIKISKAQMDKFLELKSNEESNKADGDKALVNNFRPVQKLNGRVVETNVDPNNTSSAVALTSTSFWVVAIVALLSFAF